jgi:hypothetical protein
MLTSGRPFTAVLVYLTGLTVLLAIAPARGITVYVLTAGIVCIAAPLAARRAGYGAVAAGTVGLLLPGVLLLAQLGLAHQAALALPPLDARLAALDVLLTGSAAGAPMRWAAAHPGLARPVLLVYMSLAIFMAAVWCRLGVPLRPIVAIVIAGVIAFPLYALAPAVGPYSATLSAGALRLQARNAFPSLHVALPLVWLWAAWPLGPRWRCSIAAYAAATVAAILLTGQHYVVDIVAAPCVAAASVWLADARWKPGAAALAVAVGWAVAVRLDAAWLGVPAMVWPAVLLSLSAPLLLQQLAQTRVAPVAAVEIGG